MIPARFAPVLFSLILSCIMSLLVSGVSTLKAVGMADNFMLLWASAWLMAWLLAFPVVSVVAPLTRKLVSLLVVSP